MAMIDPFGGGKFGQVAGSLLGDRRKSDKDQIKIAVGLSFLENIFKNLKVNQKQGVIDASNDVKDNYNLIFKENEELYANELTNRANYKRFIDDEDDYLQGAAIKTFNAHPNLRAELGNVNAFSAVNRENLNEEDYQAAMNVFNAIKTGERKKIIELGKNPAVNNLTFTKFNQPAMTAYKAALAEVEDDPTKKSLLGAAFNKIFGTDRNGNVRFGMKEAAELSKTRESAEILRVQKLEQSQRPLTPIEKENINAEESININSKVEKSIKYFKGTDIPLGYDFQTNKTILKLNKESFVKKVNALDYQITEEDIGTASEFGYVIPGFAGLKSVMNTDRQQLVEIAAKIKIAKSEGLTSSSEGVLNPAERRLWSIATGINVDNLEKNAMDLVLTKAKLKKAQDEMGEVNIDELKVLKKYNEASLKATVQSQLDSYLETNSGIGTIYNDNLSSESKESFVFNVFQNVEYLEETKKLSFNDAISEAIETQIVGIYKFQEDPTKFYNPASYLDNTTHRVEYVDLNVINQLSKEVRNESDARNTRDYMNTFRYVQNLTDSSGTNLRPDSLAKEFQEGDYRFFVVDIDDDENSQELKWDYEYIGN